MINSPSECIQQHDPMRQPTINVVSHRRVLTPSIVGCLDGKTGELGWRRGSTAFSLLLHPLEGDVFRRLRLNFEPKTVPGHHLERLLFPWGVLRSCQRSE